jgi:ribosomal protein L6P/L9E
MKSSLFFVNLRFVGIGFRAYVLTKHIKDLPIDFESKYIHTLPEGSTNSSSDSNSSGALKLLILKVGKSAITAYPIPAEVTIYCPTDQQQQASSQPLLLTSSNWKLLKDVASEIKSYKRPDPYKGSGIYLCDRFETESGEIYQNEFVKRKEIKKK